MKAWRAVVMAVSLLLLSGCLVSFKAPLPDSEAAPQGLVGHWTSTNAWGEPLNLELDEVGPRRYQAVTYFRARPLEREAIPLPRPRPVPPRPDGMDNLGVPSIGAGPEPQPPSPCFLALTAELAVG